MNLSYDVSSVWDQLNLRSLSLQLLMTQLHIIAIEVQMVQNDSLFRNTV